MPEVFDVAVVGAGPAGAAAAIALRRRGVSVVVLEGRSAPAWRIGETLPPAARPLLDALGVLAEVEADVHLPSHGNCSAWGADRLSITDFIFNSNGSGWQLDRARFDAQLADAARCGGAHLWYECRVTDIRQDAGGWKLFVESARRPRAVRASWLIDATGRRAAIIRRLGARRAVADSLVCVYALGVRAAGQPPDTDTRTLVEASHDGWWYTALVPGGRRTVAWLTDADLLHRPWRDAAWFLSCAQGTRHLAALLDRHGYSLTGLPACTSANSSRAEPASGNGWVSVGDAAVAFDPISAQGLLNALYTGLRGADAVADALGGDPAAVTRYAEVLATVWAAYLRNLREFYRMEQRWRGWPFWDRRHRACSPAVALA
jgi:flavin-dependent dehydrogenase